MVSVGATGVIDTIVQWIRQPAPCLIASMSGSISRRGFLGAAGAGGTDWQLIRADVL